MLTWLMESMKKRTLPIIFSKEQTERMYEKGIKMATRGKWVMRARL